MQVIVLNISRQIISMARRRARVAQGVRTVYVKAKKGKQKYSQRKNWALKKYGKKAAYGAAAGLALAVPLSLGAKYLGQPMLLEAADRGGSVAAAAAGGSVGVFAYQIADALFDRFVIYPPNTSLSGTRSGGYL